MSTFEPCEARMRDHEDDVILGCLRDAGDGHREEGGPVHQNHGHHWSALRNVAVADRCPSLISGDALGLVWRCVENAGHYPASIHMKTGYKPKAWTDEMSLNPPPVKPVHDPHRQDRIMDAAENLTTIWRDLGPMGRRNVNERVGYDLYKALHGLAIEVEGRVPLDTLDVVNETSGVTGFISPPPGDPGERRRVRENALHHARKAWPVIKSNADQQAAGIIVIAQAFEKYLTDGTGYPAPEGRLLESDGPDRRYTQADAIVDNLSEGAFKVIEAAQHWVDQAHLNNRSGLENWRHWADDHDVILINAVLTMRGMPPLESEKP